MFDISKEIEWEHLTFTIRVFAQEWSVELINHLFAELEGELTVTIFDEDWRDTINVRFFLDGEATAIPLSDIVFIVDGEEIEDIRDYTINIAAWQASTQALFISKTRHNWQEMTVKVTVGSQTLVLNFVNNMFIPPPELTTTVFAEDWRDTINIRFFLDGVLAALPLEDIEFIADGVVVEDIRDFTINVAGWQTSTNSVFISKTRVNWQHMTVNITAYGQTITHEFVNNMFIPPPELTTTVFAEDWRETINIRFFLNGVLSELPLEDIEFIADGVPVQNIRDFTINIAGWQTATNAVFIRKAGAPWQRMTVNITAYGQTLTYEFVNNMFVAPASVIFTD